MSNPFALLGDGDPAADAGPSTEKKHSSHGSHGEKGLHRIKSRGSTHSAEEEGGEELGEDEILALLQSRDVEGRCRAAEEIERVATGKENEGVRVSLVERGAVPLLVELLWEEGNRAKEAGASAIKALAKDEEAQDGVRESGGIPPLVALLRSASHELQEACAKALVNLTTKNDANEDAVCLAGGLPNLMAVLAEGSKGGRIGAAKVLANLANDEGSQEAMMREGIMGPLLEMLGSGNQSAMEAAAKCVGALTEGEGDGAEHHRILFADAGAVTLLKGLLQGGGAGPQRAAAKALGNLAEEGCNSRAMGTEPLLLELLVELQQTGGTAAKRAAGAALRALSVDADNWLAIAEAGGQEPLLSRAGSLKEVMRALHWSEDPGEQVEAAEEIAELTEDDEDERTAAAGAGAIPPLVHLMGSSNEELAKAAVLAVRNLSIGHRANQEALGRAGGIPPLVRALSSGDGEVREVAADALASLAEMTANQVTIGNEPSIPALVQMLREGEEGEQRAAVRALHQMCHDDEDFIVMADEGSIPYLVGRSGASRPLLRLIREGGALADMAERSAQILRALARHQECREVMVQEGALEVLVGVLSDGEDREDGRHSQEGMEAAVWVLCEVVYDSFGRMEQLVNHGGIPMLQRLGRAGTESARRAAGRLLNMYDEGLPVPPTPTPVNVDTRQGGKGIRRVNSLVSFVLPSDAAAEEEDEALSPVGED